MANIDVSWLEVAAAAVTNIEVSWLEVAVVEPGAYSSQEIPLIGSASGNTNGTTTEPIIIGTSEKIIASILPKPTFDVTAPSIRQYYSPSRKYVYATSGTITSKGSRS